MSAGGWPVWQGQFTPFGQEIVNALPLQPGQTDGTAMRYKFTGKERDQETGLDYFGARYYASSMGRFMSPDWSAKQEPVPYSKLDNPQTLNLYAYVGNNPLARFDADGHESTASTPGKGQECGNGVNCDKDGDRNYWLSPGRDWSGPSATSMAIASAQAYEAQQTNQTQTVTVVVTSDTVAGKEFGSHAAIWLDNGPDGALYTTQAGRITKTRVELVES